MFGLTQNLGVAMIGVAIACLLLSSMPGLASIPILGTAVLWVVSTFPLWIGFGVFMFMLLLPQNIVNPMMLLTAGLAGVIGGIAGWIIVTFI